MKNKSIKIKTKKINLEIIVSSINYCIPEKLGNNIIGYKIIVKKNQVARLKDMIYDILDIVHEDNDNPIDIGLEFIDIFKKLKDNKIIKEDFISLGLTEEMKDIERNLNINREMFTNMSGGYYHLFMSFLNKKINNNPMY